MESSLTSKGQITIPKAAREHLKVRAGDRVKLFLHPDGTVVIMPKLPVTALKGMLAGIVKKPMSLEEMDAAIEEGATEAFGRMNEADRNRVTAEANMRFLKSGTRIRDAFGGLAE